jgi:dihydropteroate synthase
MESFSNKKAKFVGILNITPDSFSDGGKYFDFESAIRQAKKLSEDGANYIDIGGDSTRPGSVCVGKKKEWGRIGEIVKEVSKINTVSVDTHFAEVAALAFDKGAMLVNDISCGGDPEMFPLLKDSEKKIILTYTRCPAPHDFSLDPPENIMQRIEKHFDAVLERAAAAGLKEKQLIIDPGMGAYLSKDGNVSWELLLRLKELKKFKLPIMLSVSRKGFLGKTSGPAENRDLSSAFISAIAVLFSGLDVDFHRVHNVKLYRELFESLGV